MTGDLRIVHDAEQHGDRAIGRRAGRTKACAPLVVDRHRERGRECGGTQRVEWRDDGVYLTGWAEIVMEGQAIVF